MGANSNDRKTAASATTSYRRNLAGFLLLLVLTGVANAAPSQSDVFKSIQDNMGKSTQFDPAPVVLLLAGGGLIFLLVLVSKRKNQKTTSLKNFNNPGRLIKELLKPLGLKSAEIKQLKLLADAAGGAGQEELDVLVLLLCPSLIAKGIGALPPKLDRKIVAQVVRKMKLNESKAAA